MSPPPVVYVGPSVSRERVRELLPGAVIRPPLQRGQLYRDRTLRFGVFVILDGVFFQHEAVPPREILDVLHDGAWVVGASSMGALRAADCAPAGMEGIGTVFAAYAAGLLQSDDEVALCFGPPTATASCRCRW